MINIVKITEVYNEVLKVSNLNTEEESNKRLLLNKLTFLVEQVVLRSKKEFKPGRDIKIPKCDAAIVRNLLIEAISGEGIVYDWFNGNVDTKLSENSILLYWQLKEPIMRAFMTGETDEVTIASWLATIEAVLGFRTAEHTVNLKRKLEEFRVNSLALDSIVRTGDIYATDEDGGRDYILKSKEHQKDILSNEILDEIVNELHTQADYFIVINQLLDRMAQDAESKARPKIEWYARVKELVEVEKASDLIPVDNESMASEYFIWFQRIAEYLHLHPEITESIENATKINNLESFFRMK